MCSLTFRRSVQKDGPNKGRPFYCCSKPRDQQCGFFQWADEEPNQFGGGGGGYGRGGARGGGYRGKRPLWRKL